MTSISHGSSFTCDIRENASMSDQPIGDGPNPLLFRRFDKRPNIFQR